MPAADSRDRRQDCLEGMEQRSILDARVFERFDPVKWPRISDLAV